MFVLRFLQRSFAVHCVAEDSTLILAQLPVLLLGSLQCTVLQRSQHSDPHEHRCPCLRSLQQSQTRCYRGVSTPDPLTQLPLLLYALLQRSFAVHCVAESQRLILWHSCHVCFAFAAFRKALCCRGVSTLILWHSCHVCSALLAAFLAVHCVAEESEL
jgi:hypothetical protein